MNNLIRSLGASVLAFPAVAALPAHATPATYVVDVEHSSVNFSVRHLVTKVRGRFTKFEGTITFDPSRPNEAKVSGAIDAASVDTNVAERDKDLRSSRFFDVEKFPRIEFASTKLDMSGDGGKSGQLHGTLTMHGVTKPVVLDVTYAGEATDPWGNRRAGFSGTTVLNRKDFGLTWNETLETGGVLVGEEVEITIEVEGTLKE
jgi:polyisoprenoid-binding protein YceI